MNSLADFHILHTIVKTSTTDADTIAQLSVRAGAG
jgi:hypothetical protein